jgi:hypothetical protein
MDLAERVDMEGEIVRKCVTTPDNYVLMNLFYMFTFIILVSALFSLLQNIKLYTEDMRHFILSLAVHWMRLN